METNKDLLYRHELCSMFCGSLDWRGFGEERIHVYVWLIPLTVQLKLLLLLLSRFSRVRLCATP